MIISQPRVAGIHKKAHGSWWSEFRMSVNLYLRRGAEVI